MAKNDKLRFKTYYNVYIKYIMIQSIEIIEIIIHVPDEPINKGDVLIKID